MSAIFVASVLLCWVASERLLQIARSKGYDGRVWHLALGLAPVAGWAIGVFAVMGRRSPDDPWFFQLSYPFWAASGLLIPAIIIFVMPRKPCGPRGVPSFYIRSRVAAEAVLALEPWLPLIVTQESGVAKDDAQMRLAMAFFAIYFLEYARRVARVHVTRLAIGTNQDIILYLRSFELDESPISHMVWRLMKLTNLFQFIRSVIRNTNEPFEVQIAEELTSKVGAVVGFGNPLDSLPGSGAERVYASDESWTDEFNRLADRAALVLLQPGDSPHLAWEAQHLRQRNLAEKLIVLIPFESVQLPSPVPFILGSLQRGGTTGGDGEQSLFGRRPASWFAFRDLMEHAGFLMGNLDPGFGSVITFDENGAACERASRLETAKDLTRVIEVIFTERRGSPEAGKTKTRGALTALTQFPWSTAAITVAFFVAGLLHSFSNYGAAIHLSPWWNLIAFSFLCGTPSQFVWYSILTCWQGWLLERKIGHFSILIVFISTAIVSALITASLSPNGSINEAPGGTFGLYGVMAGMALSGAASFSASKLFNGALLITWLFALYGPSNHTEFITCFLGLAVGLLFGISFRALQSRSLQFTFVGAVAIVTTSIATRYIPRYQDAYGPMLQLEHGNDRAINLLQEIVKHQKSQQPNLEQDAHQIDTIILPDLGRAADSLMAIQNVAPSQRPLVIALLNCNRTEQQLMTDFSLFWRKRTKTSLATLQESGKEYKACAAEIRRLPNLPAGP